MIGSRLLAGATSSIRPANARRVIAPAVRVSSQRIQSRHIHNRLSLPYKIEEGLGEFLPPQALKVVAEEYQQGLLDRLNEQVAGTAQQDKSVAQTIVEAAQDPSKVLMYTYASEALNNSFFLSCLRPPPEGETSHEESIDNTLMQQIRANFGSLEQLKSTFSAAVQGMLGQGYVWLLTDQSGQLAVYPTFGSGTLLVRATEFLPSAAGVGLSPVVIGEELHSAGGQKSYRRNPPSETIVKPLSGVSRWQRPSNPPTQTRSFSATITARSFGEYDAASVFGDSSRVGDVTRMGDKLFPLLCVSVHEHAWMSAGYGVWGKEEWMKKFWNVVHWEQVGLHYTRYYAYGRRHKTKY